MLKEVNNKFGDCIMKIRIKQNKSDDYEKVFKVRRMNYDYILVDYPNNNNIGIKSFKTEDVDLIGENKIDDFLINNQQYLKIELKRGISVAFYSALKEALKIELNEEPEVLNVLYDRYKVNKRGIWDKQIIVLVNNKDALEINASGQNFNKYSYNINISKIDKNEFINMCKEEIEKINLDIIAAKQKKKSFEIALNVYIQSNNHHI